MYHPKLFAVLPLLNMEQQVDFPNLCKEEPRREQPNTVQTVQNPTAGESLISAESLVCVFQLKAKVISQAVCLPASNAHCK